MAMRALQMFLAKGKLGLNYTDLIITLVGADDGLQ